MPPDAHALHDKASKIQIGAVFHALGGPSGVQNCAKSAQKRSPVHQISMFGFPAWMSLCHGMGVSAWHVSCVFTVLQITRKTIKMIQNCTKIANYQVTEVTKAGTKSARSWTEIKIECLPSDMPFT